MLHIELLAVENIDLRRKLLFFSFFSAILLGTFHARIVPKLAQLPTECYFIIKENVSGQNNKPFFFKNFHENGVSSQRRELLLFLKYWANYKSKLNDLINLISNEPSLFCPSITNAYNCEGLQRFPHCHQKTRQILANILHDCNLVDLAYLLNMKPIQRWLYLCGFFALPKE